MRQLANPHHRVLTGGDAQSLAQVLRVLADPVRVEVLSRLLMSPAGFTTVELSRLVGLSQPAISHHMKRLTEAGFVARRKATHPYRVVPGALAYVASFLGGEGQ